MLTRELLRPNREKAETNSVGRSAPQLRLPHAATRRRMRAPWTQPLMTDKDRVASRPCGHG